MPPTEPTDDEPLGFSAPLRSDLTADQPPAPGDGAEQEERESDSDDSTGRAA